MTSKYTIRPQPQSKFRQGNVRTIIEHTLNERLANQTYNADACGDLCKDIADELRSHVKALELPRYKYVTHVQIGELKGEGVKIGCRCFWDTDTDTLVQHTFRNESLFCVAVIYGVYYY